MHSEHSTFYLSIHGPTLLLGRDTEDSTDEDAVAHNLQPGVREPGSLGYIIVNQCVFDIFKEIEKETTHTHVNTCRCKKNLVKEYHVFKSKIISKMLLKRSM